MAAAVVTGPSRRQLVVVGVTVGLLGVAVGGSVAWRAARSQASPPVTPLGPVGLVADPSAVTEAQTIETDAGVVVALSEARPRLRVPRAGASTTAGTGRGASTPAQEIVRSPPAGRDVQRPPNPSTPRPAVRSSAPPASEASEDGTESGGSRTTMPSGNTVTRDSQGNMVVLGPDGRPLVRVDRGGDGAGAVQPSAPSPSDDPGVVERGPRSSRGGFHEGDETDATGTMDPAVFRYVYRHYQSQIASCWSSVSRGTSVAGVMVVRVRIAEADGRVIRTRVVSDTTRNAALQACVQNSIRTWRYPRPEGGDVEVDYPLRFGSGS